MEAFNKVDLTILLCFIPAFIGGIRRGFVRQITALAALIVGVWGGLRFSSFISDILREWIGSNSVIIDIISFIVVFLVIIIVVTLIGKALDGVVKIVLMGWLNRLLGVIFAILKYAFVFSIIIYIASSLDGLYDFLPHELFENSVLYPHIEQFAPKIFPYIDKLRQV